MSDQNPTAPRPVSSSSTTASPGVVPEFAAAREGDRLRYAVVGTGHRAGMYIGAITGEHADVASLVALLDTNPGRMAHYEAVVSDALGRPADLPQYAPDGLETMIAEQSVDVVIVTAPDHAHAELVARALAAGASVVVEKPLTIDEPGCRRITRAVAESGRDVVMTFNYRYAPRNSSLRQVHRGRRDRRGDQRALRVGARHRARRRLLPALAPREEELRRPARAQVRATTSTSSTGGSATSRSACTPRASCSSTATATRGPRARTATGTRPASSVTRSRSTCPRPRLRSLYLDAEQHDGYVRDRTSSVRASPSRTTWRCSSTTAAAPSSRTR